MIYALMKYLIFVKFAQKQLNLMRYFTCAKNAKRNNMKYAYKHGQNMEIHVQIAGEQYKSKGLYESMHIKLSFSNILIGTINLILRL